MENHASCRAAIDRLFVEPRSSARGWQRIRLHLEECPACREYYDRVARLHRAFVGSGKESLGMVAIEAVVLESVARRPWYRVLYPSKVRALLLASLASALLAALVVLPGLWSEGSPPQGGENPLPGMQPRGERGPEASVRLRPLCVSGDGMEVAGDTPGRAPEADPAAAGVRTTRCTMKSELVLTYVYEGAPEARYLFLVGVDPRGFPLWYSPHPGQKQSILVESSAPGTFQRLPEAIRVGVNHQPGRVRIFAFFSREPITMEEVSRVAKNLRRAGVNLTTLSTLPIETQDVLVAIADLEITP